jgi:hypothetical protein
VESIWDVATRKRICVLQNPVEPWWQRTFSLDGKTLYARSENGPVCAWDADSGKRQPAFDKQVRKTGPLVLSPDGRRLAVGDQRIQLDERGEITVFDLTTHRELRRFQPPEAKRLTSLAFSADGNYLAAAGGWGTWTGDGGPGFITLWDVRTAEERLVRTDLAEGVTALAVARDGRSLATASPGDAVSLWEVSTGRERHRFVGHESGISEVAFSPGDKYLASLGADAPIFVWDIEGRDGKPPSAVAFSAGEASGLWNALDAADASMAFRAMRQLLLRPGPAVALLRARLQPVPDTSEPVIRQRIRDLDSDAFAERERAVADLQVAVDRAAPLLRKALENKPSAEAKRQVEHILESARPGAPIQRRQGRAVEVAERLATADARALLETWSAGAEGALLTREARAAVARLKAR